VVAVSEHPEPLGPVPLREIRSAADRIRRYAVRTPLIRLQTDALPAKVWLKLENLQPIGSFKIRGAANALLQIDRERLKAGVYTASAGNMAQGVGWMARALGVPFSVIVPDHAPQTKLDAISRLGGAVIPRPFDEWWRVLQEHGDPELEGEFVHPVSDARVIAGNGTIGLEILEDLPHVDTIVVPFGGGGLSGGIASGVRTLAPDVRVFAAEVETAAPLRAAFDAGEPVEVEYTATFVDGIGSHAVLPEMWPLVHELLAGSLVVSIEKVAAAIRTLVERNRVIAEGAGAAPVAAAIDGLSGDGHVVCVVSGGNLDIARLRTILEGHTP
jgi:threonine dehydratase